MKKLNCFLLMLLVCILQINPLVHAENTHSMVHELDIPILYGDTTITNTIDAFRDLQSTIIHRPKVNTHGIYYTAYSAASENMIDWLIDISRVSSINAVVIDIKDDSGYLTIDSDDPLIQSIGSSIDIIDDIESTIQRLHNNGIYCIARIVTFKDPYLANVRPQWALYTNDGQLYKDDSGLAWIDPTNHEVWDYILACCKAAVDVGFDEIQFDYIRFTTEGKIWEINYNGMSDAQKMAVICEAVDYFTDYLKPLGVYVSADVFGSIIGSEIDSAIVGQNYVQLAKELDYISPMIYPSHYGNGFFGLDVPDLYPYDVIYNALSQSNALLDPLRHDGQTIALIRPWLQDFTASYLRKYREYEDEEVGLQVQASYDCGSMGWLLWNASNTYHVASFYD